MTAIVTDVHYRMSLALIRDLGQAGAEVIACEKEGLPALGAASRWCKELVRLPEENWADGLWELCRTVGRQRGCRPALLPVGAGTLGLLARERERFQDVCGLCIPTAEQLALFNSKAAVNALARSLDIPVPDQFIRAAGESAADFAARMPMPCVVKPDWGEGLGLPAGARYVIARTPGEAADAYERFAAMDGGGPIVQGYLPGRALGCSVIADGGRVAACLCHRRIREWPVSGGPSTCCESVQAPELEEHVRHLAAHTGFTGPAMFEFKEDAAGVPRLLEVNPRVWGSYPLTRAAKTGMSLTWAALAWNGANAASPVPLPAPAPFRRAKLSFGASELAAAAGYLRAGRPGMGLRAIGSALDPFGKKGVFEWGDPRPGLAYGRTLLKRGRRE